MSANTLAVAWVRGSRAARARPQHQGVERHGRGQDDGEDDERVTPGRAGRRRSSPGHQRPWAVAVEVATDGDPGHGRDEQGGENAPVSWAAEKPSSRCIGTRKTAKA